MRSPFFTIISPYLYLICATMNARASRKGMKLKTLSINDKRKLLDRVDAGASMRMMCEEFDIKTSTFYDIKKNKEKIRRHSLTLDDPGSSTKQKKRIRAVKHVDLDEAVYRWYKQERASNVSVRGIDIQHAAGRLAEHLGIRNFVASSGWLYNFRSRHCMGNRKVVGESASADESSVEPFRRKLVDIMDDSGLLIYQLYNADETGLYWKAAPSNTQAAKNEKHIPGRKTPKDRLSALACANADGTHRLKPMLVGKAKKPRALKNIMNNLPVIYRGNKTAWFTRLLFQEWFHNYFVPSVVKFQLETHGIARDNIKAILLLDNAPAHPCVEDLVGLDGRIKVMYLPPNTTSIMQPMDQGVIEACKRHYRFKYQSECLVVLENETDVDDGDTRGARTLENFKAYNIRNAVFNWAEAWHSLNATTLANAWNKLIKGTDVEVDFAGFGPNDFVNLLQRGGENQVTEDNVVDWLQVDSDEQGFRHETVEDIAASVSNPPAEPEEEDSDEEEDTPKAKLSDLRFHLDKALDIIARLPDQDDHYRSIHNIRASVIKTQHSQYKQGKISDFFKPMGVPLRHRTPSASSESSLQIASGSGQSGSGSISDTSTTSTVVMPVTPEVPEVLMTSDSE